MTKLGATGKFPHGKLDPSDEGELVFTISRDADGNIRIAFGKPVAWLAMPAAQAAEFARLILRWASLR